MGAPPDKYVRVPKVGSDQEILDSINAQADLGYRVEPAQPLNESVLMGNYQGSGS